MSNILFVLYHDFSANSAVHVHNFANQLVDLDRSGNALQYHAISIPDGDPRSQIDEPHRAVLASVAAEPWVTGF